MGIRRSSLERRHQTTVGSRHPHVLWSYMLKFIRCLRNKLAGSSEEIDVHVIHYGIESNLATKKCNADELFLSGS